MWQRELVNLLKIENAELQQKERLKLAIVTCLQVQICFQTKKGPARCGVRGCGLKWPGISTKEILYGQQPADHGDALLGLTSNTPKGVTWLRLILQLPFALSSQVIKHFRPLVSQFFVHTL